MSRQNNFENFGMQVDQLGEFTSWTIVRLLDGKLVLRKPGDKVPDNIDRKIPAKYFSDRQEAHEFLKQTARWPKEMERKLVEENKREKRYRLTDEDWEELFIRLSLISSERDFLNELKGNENQEITIREVAKYSYGQPLKQIEEMLNRLNHNMDLWGFRLERGEMHHLGGDILEREWEFTVKIYYAEKKPI